MNLVFSIYNNPLVSGHAFVAPAKFLLNKIWRETDELRAVKREEQFLRQFQGHLPTPGNPVDMTLPDVIALQISTETGHSSRPALKGKVFYVESLPSHRMRVSVELIKDKRVPEYSPKDERCKHASNLTGLIVIALLTSPLTVTSLAVGMVVKSLACRCDSPYKRPLHVERLGANGYSLIAEQIEQWNQIANRKTGQAASQQLPADIFSDSTKISRAVAQCLREPFFCAKHFDEVHLCRDDRGVLQGIMLLHNDASNDRLEITNVLTHPHNVRSPINEEEFERVEGTGLALTRLAAERCQALGRSRLYIEGLNSVRPFYDRVGFEITNDLRMEGDYCMDMSLAKIRRFLYSF